MLEQVPMVSERLRSLLDKPQMAVQRADVVRQLSTLADQFKMDEYHLVCFVRYLKSSRKLPHDLSLALKFVAALTMQSVKVSLFILASGSCRLIFAHSLR